MREDAKTEEARPEDRGLPGSLALVASALAHLLLLLPVLYVVGLGFESFQFFSWHPICMSLGAGLLIAEAVYSISGEAWVTKKVSRASRVTLHWILHGLGLCLLIVGLTIVVVNKNRKGSEHFATTHGQLGLSALVVVFLVAGFGVLANNARWLYPRLRPVLVKVVHAFAGIGATILLLATLINGTYGGWWTHVGASETGRDLVFASLFLAGLLVLAKPLIGAAARTRVLARPPRSAQTATEGSSTRE